MSYEYVRLSLVDIFTDTVNLPFHKASPILSTFITSFSMDRMAYLRISIIVLYTWIIVFRSRFLVLKYQSSIVVSLKGRLPQKLASPGWFSGERVGIMTWWL